ncbi:MAG: hypothetical protein JW814_03745 [Candidatus Krumholzibacteriota bacterium]|nr:hypothetical protein [Candidatus Krumholzibacteriota bacterium]
MVFFNKKERLSILRAVVIAAVCLSLPGCVSRKVDDAGHAGERIDHETVIMTMIDARDYQGVVDLTGEMISGGIGNPWLLGQRALSLGEIGRVDEAITLFEEIIVEDYMNCENHLNFAVLLMKTGRTGRAMTEFSEAGKFCGVENRAVIKRNLAVANIKLGREEAALANVEEGLEGAPGDSYLLGLKGMLIASSRPAAAESLFSVAISEGDMNDDFIYQLGILFLTTGRAREAILPLERYYSRRPDDIEGGLNYAESLIRSRSFADAEKVLLEMGGENGDWKIESKLARIYYATERFKEALAVYENGGDDPKILDRVAMCLHWLGRTEEALEIEEGVVRSLPDWTTGMINLSAMLATLGRLDRAGQILQKVLEIEPDNMTAAVNLRRIKESREDPSRE